MAGSRGMGQRLGPRRRFHGSIVQLFEKEVVTSDKTCLCETAIAEEKDRLVDYLLSGK